jgi:hypothetical protein
MLEVQNINPIGKGSLLATCDVYIQPWHYTFLGVKIFEKGANRWISMPTIEKEFNGEIKHIETGRWDSDGVKNRFRSQIMGAIDKYLAENPDLKPEDAIKENEDFPF